LHDTPVNTKKKARITSRRRNGLTRRAPGSPASEARFTTPPGVRTSSSLVARFSHAWQCIGTPILARET
jgi:hypothetical protein